jgi:predicted signal transduction protein with EAL and GGDEF domain
VAREIAEAVRVRRGDPQPTERIGPTSLALAAIAIAGGVAVLLGAEPVVATIPVAAAVALAVLLVMTDRRAARTEAALQESDVKTAALFRDLRQQMELRENLEARLTWRSRLGSMRRASQNDSLSDPETGLLPESWLIASVSSRIASGRRRLTPVAVVLLEVLERADIENPDPLQPTLTARAVTTSVREADGAFRLDDGSFALVLDDTDDMGALVVTRRVGDSLESWWPGAVVRAGVACYPAHGLTSEDILDRATDALEEARRWPQHRIEVAPAEH